MTERTTGTSMSDSLESAPKPRRAWWVRPLFVSGAALFAAFWIWALFFASKEPVNGIEDRAWADRAQQICADANTERNKLFDNRELAAAGPELIREHADIVDRATDIIESMLDDVVAVPPASVKGRDLIPQWEADYRTWIADRRVFTDRLRATGTNDPFYETEDNGLPISERIETFAGDNHMPDCSPARDLSR